MFAEYSIVDLSVELKPDMFNFPDNPPFKVSGPYSAISGENREYCYELAMTTQTGTHIQGPHYFLAQGKTIDQYPLDTFEGRVILIDVTDLKIIDEKDLASRLPLNCTPMGRIILFRTGFMDDVVRDIQQGNQIDIPQMMQKKIGLTLAGAKYLIKLAPKMIGVDSFGLEPLDSKNYEVDYYLCQQGMIFLEGLINLDKVSSGDWLEAFPLPLPGVEGTPCRALAKVAAAKGD